MENTMRNPMNGQTCLVTGATSGIGLETARALARLGAKVIGVGRDPEKAGSVAARIREETGSRHVDYLLADLSSLQQTRSLGEAVRERAPRLDVLINNAGGFFARRQLSPDGIELTLALNLLSPFLLTNLLLEPLRASAAGRVINVSSNAHLRGRMDFEDLESRRRYPMMGMGAYGNAKLGLVMFTYELARRLVGTTVTANVLHPGFVATGFARNNGWLFRVFMPLLRPFGQTPMQGAQTVIYLATSPQVDGVTGKYFFDCMPVPSSAESCDQETAERLWRICMQMTGLEPSV